MEADQYHITHLLPHRDPVLLIDRLLDAHGTQVRSVYTIREDSFLVSEDHFTEAGLLENMAQTCAAFAGSMKPEQPNADILLLAGVNKLHVHQLPATGKRIETTVRLLHSMLNYTSMHAQVHCGEELIAEGELRFVARSVKH